MRLRVLDLFSGIGGFSLGLERTGGFETVAFCEIEDYPRRVLAKHWPGVPIYDDVRTLTADTLRRDGIAVDVICGGFPCQDISIAGRGAGLVGERSGLWREYARLVGELRPRFVLVENVAALLSRGIGDVLGDLAALGYDAEWHCIPAAAVGAPHHRDRVWIVAYAEREQLRQQPGRWDGAGWPGAALAAIDGEPGEMADANGGDEHGRPGHVQMGWGAFASEIADAGHAAGDEWAAEPAIRRVVNGVPNRLERLTGLGNAVVPQIPELIGRAILKAEGIA
jgi:DNA (cytosine-5)-methyltransferase 1